MRTLALALPLAFAALAGCANQRYFAPRENENGTGPGGYPAAVYPVSGPDVAGELRIWSRGALGDEDPATGGDRVEVHVGFELENTGTTPLELGGIRSERDNLSLVRVEGETTAPPGQTSRIDTWFLAPGVESARDLSEFAVRFSVLAGERALLTQVTPFSTWYRPDPRDYDPWFFGPHGYSRRGFGLGMAWCWY